MGFRPELIAAAFQAEALILASGPEIELAVHAIAADVPPRLFRCHF